MNATIAIIAAAVLVTASAAALPAAHAHTTVEEGGYTIEVGWGIEPPVVGYRNTLVFDVSIPSGDGDGVTSGVKNAFRGLDAVVVFGGASKPLDISTDRLPGHYFSDIIPTKTGTYAVRLDGEIDGTPVSVEIPIEDAEATAILDFPPRTSGSSGSDDLGAIKRAVSAMQRDLAAVRDGTVTGTDNGPGNPGMAYDLAVLGLSLGAAAVILSVVAMIKRK